VCIRYRPGKVGALRKLLRESPASPYVFISERRAPLSAAGYQRMVARAGVVAKFTFLVHTCCGTPAGSSLPTTVTTLAPSKPISASPLNGFDAQSVQEFLEGLTSSLDISRNVRQVALPSPRRSVGAGRRDLLSSVRRARPRVKTSQQDGENAG
jgi:hypothetical protein